MVTAGEPKLNMEVYFKQLISTDASLEKLVDDLALVVHGVDDLARTVGVNGSEQPCQEMAGRLNRLKERCRELSERTVAGARMTDQFLRKNPYSAIGLAFGLGLLAGARVAAFSRKAQV
jgi:ElaB/YqjD/DUF883 family membrane-anchored ribosome-binding protein